MNPGVNIKDFNKISRFIEAPDLLEIQKNSFAWLIEKGLKELLDEFQSNDESRRSGKVIVEFVDYSIDQPTSNPIECKEKGRTYHGVMKLMVRITFIDTGEMKEQSIVVGPFPYMTPTGSFIINGVERVIVAQLTRAPGVYFESINFNRTGKWTHKATIIPDRGSWLEFETEPDNTVYIHLDKRSKKIPATMVLRALGLNDDQMREAFLERNIVNVETRNDDFFLHEGKELAEDIYDYHTGDDIFTKGTLLTKEMLEQISKMQMRHIKIYDKVLSEYAKATFIKDEANSIEEAKKFIFLKLRPGERYTPENADSQIYSVLLDPRRNDLGEVGRYKVNKKLGLEINERIVTAQDIISIIRYFSKIDNSQGSTDNRDHLGNKRVRLVGELLKNNMRIGLLRCWKNMNEKISITPEEDISPQSCFNPRPLLASINEFFGLGQLSQFMDETNPLSSLTHKRRLSSLGPGGLHRERAGAEVRDVHHSHYGRICPIETPEGENVGLINSLNVYARIDERGFIISPYLKVKAGRVLDQLDYLTADDEEEFRITQANTPIDTKTNHITSDWCVIRKGAEISEVSKEEVDYIDVSPLQVFSVSANLIPFLEHDDANRALMGCNMQHQAIPLNSPEVPLVGTGLEPKAAIDSGSVVTSKKSGVVSYVDSTRIVISSTENGSETIKVGHFNKNLINEVLCEDIPGIGTVEEVIDGVMLNKIFKKGLAKVRHAKLEDLELIKLAELVVYEKNEALIDMTCAETMYYLSSGKVLIEEGKRITSTLLNRIFNDKQSFVKVYDPENHIIELPVYEIRFVKKENLPDNKIIVSSKPISKTIKYGDILTNDQFMLMNDQNLESITVIAKDKLKTSDVFLQHKKLRKPLVLAKNVVLGSKTIAKEGEVLDQDLLAKLIDLGVEEVSVGKESEEVLDKFKRTNQDTVVNKHPLVRAGAVLSKNMPIIDGGGADRGRLALGRNLLVAYIPWRGYNYQDAIVLSEKLVVDDVLTSTHIKEYKVSVRETKVGPEEITRDIPNVPEEQLKNLDETGIILVGTEVGPNDILVGKITPKAESEFTPEMKLWRAMFDKKGQDVKDSSLRVSPGERGTVIGIQVLTRDEDDLPIGVNKIVKVYIGEKRKIQVGDKLSGRHGNKGVISRILPVQDMPFLEDGTPVDIVLNSLGVPSRMNVGQIMEALLGLYAKKIGHYCVTPPFSGVTPEEMLKELQNLGFHEHGKQILYDGYTGEAFTNHVTVGYAYIMKLNHMVEDKIHARSTGPYALITQQPLGGKAQFGGQRFGEMEVWALEAYGAAYTLQEMLTVKSDDTEGRLNAYESICTRKMISQSNNPESFRVIINELQGLGIKIDLVKEEEIQMEEPIISPLEEKELTLEELDEISLRD